MKIYLVQIVTLFFLLYAPFVSAGDAVEHHVDNLLPIVITGTRSEKYQSDTPVRTEVISRAQIESQHAQNVSDALKTLPNLLLKPIHGKSGVEVWMQGLNSDQVKILIDGMPISASTGSTVDLTQLSTVDIERIEIVKGATSALYGSSAMGGVINIITRRPAEPLTYNVTLEAGSFGEDNPDGGLSTAALRRLSSHVLTRQGAWSSRLNLDVSASDGFDATPTDWATQGAQGSRITLGGGLTWEGANDTRYDVGLTGYMEDLTNNLLENAGGKLIKKVKEENSERLRGQITGRWQLSEGELSASVVKETLVNISYQDVVATVEKEKRREAKLDFEQGTVDFMTSLGGGHDINMGLLLFKETLSQQADQSYEVASGTERKSIELYVQDDFFVGDWEFLPGVRLQNDSDFGNQASPKLNFRYDFLASGMWQTFLRGGVGLGYRVPNLKERHYQFDHSHLGYVVQGNSALLPEKSLSYQLGLGLQNGDATIYNINLFLNEISNLISTTLDKSATQARSDNVSVYQYQNIAQARTYGIELSVEQAVSDRFSMSGGYTWLTANNPQTNRTLTKRPEHQLKMHLNYQIPQWQTQVSLVGRYQSFEYVDSDLSQKSPAWSEFDVKLNQPLNTQLSVFGGVNNLTDSQKDFADGSDFRPEIGRFIYVGVRLTD